MERESYKQEASTKEGAEWVLAELDWQKCALLPAIAQDCASGAVLMLGFMDRRALELTLETGYMHYFSRSKNRIWKKGESSGHTQRVESVAIDCDRDTLLFQVTQVGAACHTGQRSCFFIDAYYAPGRHKEGESSKVARQEGGKEARQEVEKKGGQAGVAVCAQGGKMWAEGLGLRADSSGVLDSLSLESSKGEVSEALESSALESNKRESNEKASRLDSSSSLDSYTLDSPLDSHADSHAKSRSPLPQASTQDPKIQGRKSLESKAPTESLESPSHAPCSSPSHTSAWLRTYGVIDTLYHSLLERKMASATSSYTASLYAKGVDGFGKKIIEEAGEVLLALKDRDRGQIVYECADLLYHIFVGLAYYNIHPEQVLAELERRLGLSGLAEKASRTAEKNGRT